MKDSYEIAEEIKLKGFSVAKCNMNDEAPDEWLIFGVWFYLKTNFYVDLDWRTGKYYFYMESSKELAEAKEPKNKSLDIYSAEEFLSHNLLKNYEQLNTIAQTIHSDGFYLSEDLSTINLFDDEDNRCVLFWQTEEMGIAITGVVNKKIPLIMLVNVDNQDLLLDEAKKRGFSTHIERLDDEFDDIVDEKIDGFDDVYFFF